MHFVYVLKNMNTGMPYIGYTEDLNRRLREHRSSENVRLVYYEAYVSEKDARIRERKLKAYGNAWTGLKRRLVSSWV
jgi:predicted GIY-YIG superfamily endonuclease